MIRCEESRPCTVINTQQINRCTTDGSGSAIKGYTEVLSSDPSYFCSQFNIFLVDKTQRLCVTRIHEDMCLSSVTVIMDLS